MTNFVLLGCPNFVLVPTEAARAEPCCEVAPPYLNRRFSDLLSQLGVCLSTACESERLRLDKATRPLLRPVLERYGFERFPTTLGELGALFDYCDRLDALSGTELFQGEQRAQWHQLASGLMAARQTPPWPLAVDLYRCGDLTALREYHRQEDTLTQVGRLWRFVPGR